MSQLQKKKAQRAVGTAYCGVATIFNEGDAEVILIAPDREQLTRILRHYLSPEKLSEFSQARFMPVAVFHNPEK